MADKYSDREQGMEENSSKLTTEGESGIAIGHERSSCEIDLSAVEVRPFCEDDLEETVVIWNEVVEGGKAFPQLEPMTKEEARRFFSSQYTAVAAVEGKVAGLYILHPNNIGRVGHIGNASYAVSSQMRGRHIGELLVKDSLVQARNLGYGILQFNAVVDSNVYALHLYKKLGFVDLGIIPGGFLNKEGEYEDIHVMYYDLSL